MTTIASKNCTDDLEMVPELAGADTVYFSVDLAISEAVYAKLEKEKEAAQIAARVEQAHCPDWLGARVFPNGGSGGAPFLIETDDFTLKLSSRNMKHRPGLYVELRSHFLHTHPEGPAGACEEALCWAREQLYYDQDASLVVVEQVSFDAAKLSRVDLHCDWQGGYAPSLEHISEDLRCFIRPGKVKWGLFGEGHTFTGYTFVHGDVRARLYNKSVEVQQRHDDSYFTLLAARNGERFNPDLDVWRLEYQLPSASSILRRASPAMPPAWRASRCSSPKPWESRSWCISVAVTSAKEVSTSSSGVMESRRF